MKAHYYQKEKKNSSDVLTLSWYANSDNQILDSTLHNPLGKVGKDVDGYQTKPYENGRLASKSLDIGQYHNFKSTVLEKFVNFERQLH